VAYFLDPLAFAETYGSLLFMKYIDFYLWVLLIVHLVMLLIGSLFACLKLNRGFGCV